MGHPRHTPHLQCKVTTQNLDLPAARALQFIKRARSLGFSVDEVRQLLDLWRNRSRQSKTVKRLAIRHLQTLDAKLVELQAMRNALVDLVDRCSDDDRPECPIMDDLAESDRAARS